MVHPSRSPVAPRVLSRRLGETVPLVDEIESMLKKGERTYLRIDGEGAESALSHLAFHFAIEVADGRLRLDDESFPPNADNAIVTVRTRREVQCDTVRRLAPWCRDDFIEYLLAIHPSQCASVMERLKSSIVRNSPEIDSRFQCASGMAV